MNTGIPMGTARVIRGDARNIPLPDNSVDLVVSSPPYFSLRSYQDGGEHYEGQIGDEATPAEFVKSLLEVTRECVRVLQPGGSLWINLGDKYSGYNNGSGKGRSLTDEDRTEVRMRDLDGGANPAAYGAPAKSLIGIPWRYAIACIDELDLILRAEVIWCLSGGTKVYAEIEGEARPINLNDLVRHYKAEQVRLWNGSKWTQVLGWNETPDTDDAIEFEFRNGERVGCTVGHQWPTARGLLRADEIRVGDVVDSVRLPEPANPTNPALLPDDDIGWLVGLYIAEGSRSETTVQIAGNMNEHARHERLARIAASLGASFNVYQTAENAVSANMRGPVLRAVIDAYVSPGTAKTKGLHKAAWLRSDQFLAAVVEGYLDGDGHYDVLNSRYRLAFTSNDDWAADLRALAARLGAGCRLKRCTHKGFGKEYPGWRGEWRWQRSTHHNTKFDGEVVAIRKSRARKFYDLGVADAPNTFALASGLLTHNSKPNGMPESVTDRVRRSHEQWFHFTLNQKYYANVDPIREPHATVSGGTRRHGGAAFGVDKAGRGGDGARHTDGHPLGKLPSSVWEVSTEPLRVPESLGVDHFAAFPTLWPKRLIQAWCPEGGTVLDPFGGTGTTAMVAKALGRNGISLDMSADYCKLAEWRTNDRDQLAKVLGIAKVEQPAEDQLSLFGDAEPAPDEVVLVPSVTLFDEEMPA